MDLATQKACLAIQCGGLIAQANGGSASSSDASMSTSTTVVTNTAVATTTVAAGGNAAPAQLTQNLGLNIVAAGAALIGLAL